MKACIRAPVMHTQRGMGRGGEDALNRRAGLGKGGEREREGEGERSTKNAHTTPSHAHTCALHAQLPHAPSELPPPFHAHTRCTRAHMHVHTPSMHTLTHARSHTRRLNSYPQIMHAHDAHTLTCTYTRPPCRGRIAVVEAERSFPFCFSKSLPHTRSVLL